MKEKSTCTTYSNGTKLWHLNGQFHREDNLPAGEYADGFRSWYVNGECHRTDGPAIEYVNGNKEWWLNGKRIYCNSQKEFKKFILLLTFQ